ncbi:hypothetical protein [Jannaschia sp. M317]|uniref:hypothetical protein n=1 Tax=Jannaschia sp. M317 TaxID=2867011 RepID=UPI00220105BA|nr:hypothetical protein [Jannaschia sp. M317]UWQ18594.1 hypothetical protein K3551_04700 [Jannaschia sp. M317]
MLLIAGLLGLAASGLLLIDTSPDEEDADTGAVPDVEEQTAESDEDDSSPLTEALDPEEPEQNERPDLAPSNAGLTPTQIIRDQVAGAHLSDHVGAEDGAVITHDDDAMFGNGGNNQMQAGDYGDLLIGNDGDDTLGGGAARDELHGGDGDDDLFGGAGDDILHGDWGDDSLDGDDGDDLLLGGDGDDTLDGGAGADRLFGMLGLDVLRGGAGDDVLDGTQSDSADMPDTDGGDTLDGGDGNDTLAGGHGDNLTGGQGQDTFLFRAPSAGAFAQEFETGPDDAAWIADFDASEDAIEIIYDSSLETAPGVPPVLELLDANGVTELRIGGNVVARLDAGTPIGPDDIRLVPAA